MAVVEVREVKVPLLLVEKGGGVLFKRRWQALSAEPLAEGCLEG